MSAHAASFSATWDVGRKYKVTLTLPPIERGALRSAMFEWEPDVPRRLSASEMRQYRRGRNEALQRLAEQLGGNVLVLE